MNAMILLAQGAMNMADSLATANPVLTEVNAPEMNMLDIVPVPYSCSILHSQAKNWLSQMASNSAFSMAQARNSSPQIWAFNSSTVGIGVISIAPS